MSICFNFRFHIQGRKIPGIDTFSHISLLLSSAYQQMKGICSLYIQVNL